MISTFRTSLTGTPPVAATATLMLASSDVVAPCDAVSWNVTVTVAVSPVVGLKVGSGVGSSVGGGGKTTNNLVVSSRLPDPWHPGRHGANN